MRCRRLGLIVVISLLAALLVACGGQGTSSQQQPSQSDADQPAGAQELQKVTAVIPFPNYIPFFPLAVSQVVGYFAEEGLEVETVVVDGSSEIYRQLAVGGVEFGFPNPSVMIRGGERGDPVIGIYVLYQNFVSRMIVPEDSPIQTVADLKGARLGLSSVTGEGPMVRAIMKEAGLDPDQDVEIIEIGEGAGGAVAALQQNRIDAYYSNFANVAGIQYRGFPIRSLDLGKFGAFYDSNIAVNTQLLENDPDLAVRFARAIAKGTLFGMTSPEAAIEAISSRWPDQTTDKEWSLELLKETAALYTLPPYAEGRFGWHEASIWEDFAQFLYEGGQTDSLVPIDGLFTNELIDAINDFDRTAVENDARNYK